MNPSVSPPTNAGNDAEFFAGDSEMAALMRSYHWNQTPLGPASHWPQSLKTTVRIVLTSRFAMWMGWGEELTFFYNDAYGEMTLANKHPWALAKPAWEVWAEIWSSIGPRIEKVLSTGEATWDSALMLFLERSGYTEETYHTFSYSPLADDNGTISGMLCVVSEETERIIGERRLALLRDVAAALGSVQMQEEVFEAVVSCISSNPRDLPFTLIYLFEESSDFARLVATSGVPHDAEVAVPTIGVEAGDTPLPLKTLIERGEPILIDNIPAQFENLPVGPWDKPAQQALLYPIPQQGQERPAGFLLTGLNPYRLFDSEYRDFVGLLVGQLAASLANARAYETERKRAEALAELDRAKTTFFSNVSHEFRTPLALMLGPIEEILAKQEVAQEGNSPSEDREMLVVAHRNAMRLLKLVNTLLDFTRIEAGRVEASYVATDLSAYTAELASVFRSAIEKAGMRFVVECTPLPEPVYVDRDMWEKVVLNLLSNAFKFTLEGEIGVRLRAEHGVVICEVSDTGAGISEEQLPHIFERFHRVEGTRARTQEGTGIGLALVQELVKLHGGKVSVRSRLGEGTTFTVQFPFGTMHLPPERIHGSTTLSSTALHGEIFVEEALRWLPEEQKRVQSVPFLPGASHLTGKQGEGEASGRILLADDNADMREYVQRLLQPYYEVIAVANGTEALQAIDALAPDLVLSDVMMPELDGFGLLQALRSDSHTASIPIILLSARAGEEARIEGLSAGADDYLTKPFSARELLARVRSQLAMARLRNEATKVEQALRSEAEEAKERLEDVLTGINDLFMVLDNEGRFTFVNDQVFEVTGIPKVEMIGKTIWELFPAILDSELDVALRTAMVDQQPTYLDYYYYPLERWHEIRIYPSKAIMTLFATDITERKLAEEKLGLHQAEIENMNVRLKRAMIETHHRVKNNLQLISALIDMQRHTYTTLVPIEEFTRLATNVRALSVIHDILTQEAKAGNDQETLSGKAVLERLLQGLEQTTGERNLVYAIDDLRLSGRQATTLALITNELVANALKHGEGEMNISLRVDGDQATLIVCDNGPGFPDGFDGKTNVNTGLELVDNIVRWDLQGMISFSNRPEGGAQILVSFPATIIE